MTLIKASFWSAIATIIRLAASFVIAKILAVFLGPVGFAVIGQFQNFVQMVLIFAGSMIQTGMVKYVAEFKDNESEKAKILSTGLIICLVGSSIIGLVLIIFRHFFAAWILNDVKLSWLMIVFGLTLVLYVLNTFFISILNGEGAIKRLTIINVSTSLVGLCLTFFLARIWNLSGVLLALVISPSLIFLITLGLIAKTHWFKLAQFMQGSDKDYLIKLLKYALMAVVSALVLPLAQIIVREYLVYRLSWQDAGYWQAMTRISDAYLLVFTTIWTVYYLPKLSSLSEVYLIKREIMKSYQVILPLVILLAMIIYFLKDRIILLLFIPAFMPMQSLFLFQLMGDVVKIGSWIVACTMLAKAMTKLFILTEIIFSISFVVLTFIFVNIYGLVGVTIAFFVNYSLYWLFMCVYFKKRLR
jgi:polysaccharide transporter, PST family